MSAGFKVVAETAEQQSHPSSVDYCSLWSFICPRMNGRQRQQAVILRATAAEPDPRWNETSNFKTPIRIKIPVTLVDWVSMLIWWLVITTVHDADIQSLSARTVFFPSALGKKRGFWWWGVEEHSWCTFTNGWVILVGEGGKWGQWGNDEEEVVRGRKGGSGGNTAEGIAHDRRHHCPGGRVLCL